MLRTKILAHAQSSFYLYSNLSNGFKVKEYGILSAAKNDFSEDFIVTFSISHFNILWWSQVIIDTKQNVYQ